jgi:hypothetical protein
MNELRTPDLQLYRVSIGMQQRTVYAEGMFDAAHKCGLGSGDLLRAEIELLDESTGKSIARGGFKNG